MSNRKQIVVHSGLYAETANLLGQGSLIGEILSGRLVVDETSQRIFNPFPPALVPLWPTGAQTVVGYWKHWFVEERTPTFAEYYGFTTFGQRDMVFERARSLPQLMYLVLLEKILDADEIDDGVQEFADHVGIKDLDAILEVAMNGGVAAGFVEHPCFQDDLPLSCFEGASTDDYSGDFPHAGAKLTPEVVRRWSPLEVHSGFKKMQPNYDLRRRVAASDFTPVWFKSNDLCGTFNSALNSGDLAGAWLSLNSPGWKFADAKAAIEALAQAGNRSDFSQIAQVWRSLPFADDARY